MMKHKIKYMVLAGLVGSALAQTPTVPAPPPPVTTVTLSEVDQLRLENAFLKASADNDRVKSAQQQAQDSLAKARALIKEYEAGYNAHFDESRGVFVKAPEPKGK